MIAGSSKSVKPEIAAVLFSNESNNSEVTQWGFMNQFLNRFFRAAKLDVSLYQEIVADVKTLNQALIVVFIYSMASAYGTFGAIGGATKTNIVMVTTLMGWYVWAFSSYIIGARILPEAGTQPDRKALRRVMGFASAPGTLRALGFVRPGAVGPLWRRAVDTGSGALALP